MWHLNPFDVALLLKFHILAWVKLGWLESLLWEGERTVARWQLGYESLDIIGGVAAQTPGTAWHHLQQV